MITVKRYFVFLLFSFFLLYPYVSLFGANQQGQKAKSAKDSVSEEKLVFPPMPEPGKKVPIGDGYYILYGFDKRPKLGMAIMKVEIFTKEGKKYTSLEVKGDAGMPSMSGAHETGDKNFSLSQKGDYLLPINIVMPGDWEIRFTVLKDGKPIWRGRYNFNV